MQIGVFWIYNNQIFSKKELLKNIEKINNFKDSNLSHYKVWEEIKYKHKDFYMFEYEQIPRGRIVYDTYNRVFLIYCNNDILNNSKAKKMILKEFRIKEDYLFFYDEHYKINS